MKKEGTLLLALMLIFAAGLIGFFVGRNMPGQISVSAAETIPTVSRILSADSEKTADSEVQNALININTADASQLRTLPGIGEKIAQRIIDYRNEHGTFSAVDELTYVDGIGDKTMDAIRDLVTTGG